MVEAPAHLSPEPPMPGHRVAVGRVYSPRGVDDGSRVLVDRLWPRGLTKIAADLDDWCRDVAPSTALRRWYGHDPVLFEEFSRRYLEELQQPTAIVAADRLRHRAGERNLTLLTATKRLDISGAAVLAAFLTGHENERRPGPSATD